MVLGYPYLGEAGRLRRAGAPVGIRERVGVGLTGTLPGQQEQVGAYAPPDPAGSAVTRLGGRYYSVEQPSQIPTISSVWLTSVNPCWGAMRLVHFSTAGPTTSTVRPHSRQTR